MSTNDRQWKITGRERDEGEGCGEESEGLGGREAEVGRWAEEEDDDDDDDDDGRLDDELKKHVERTRRVNIGQEVLEAKMKVNNLYP